MSTENFLEFVIQLSREEAVALLEAIGAHDQMVKDAITTMQRYGVDGPAAKEYRTQLSENSMALQAVKGGLLRLLARKPE